MSYAGKLASNTMYLEDSGSDSLTQPILIPSALALPEQDLHTFRHVDPEESVEIAHDRSERCKTDRFEYAVVFKVFSPEGCDLEVELYHKDSV